MIKMLGGSRAVADKQTSPTTLLVLPRVKMRMSCLSTPSIRRRQPVVLKSARKSTQAHHATPAASSALESSHTKVVEPVSKYDHIIVGTGCRDKTSQRAPLPVSTSLLVHFVSHSIDIWPLAKVAGVVEEMRTVNPEVVACAILNRSDLRGQGAETVAAARMLREIETLINKGGSVTSSHKAARETKTQLSRLCLLRSLVQRLDRNPNRRLVAPSRHAWLPETLLENLASEERRSIFQ